MVEIAYVQSRAYASFNDQIVTTKRPLSSSSAAPCKYLHIAITGLL